MTLSVCCFDAEIRVSKKNFKGGSGRGRETRRRYLFIDHIDFSVKCSVKWGSRPEKSNTFLLRL
jgi:hypothetical protein